MLIIIFVVFEKKCNDKFKNQVLISTHTNALLSMSVDYAYLFCTSYHKKMIILLNFNSNTKLDNGVTCKANSKQNEIRRNVPKQKKIRESKSRQNHSLITSGRINMLD